MTRLDYAVTRLEDANMTSVTRLCYAFSKVPTDGICHENQQVEGGADFCIHGLPADVMISLWAHFECVTNGGGGVNVKFGQVRYAEVV